MTRLSGIAQGYCTANTNLQLEGICFELKGAKLPCDVSTGHARPIVSTSRSRQIFDLIHRLFYPSVCATKNTATLHLYGMACRDNWVFWKAVHSIPIFQCPRAHQSPTWNLQDPHYQFDNIHVDLLGPLPPSNGYTYLLTMVDQFSWWPEAIPLKDTTTASCAQALVFHLFTSFGILVLLISQRKPQLTSQLWLSIALLLGTWVRLTTYGPPPPVDLLGGKFPQKPEICPNSLPDRSQLDSGATHLGYC